MGTIYYTFFEKPSISIKTIITSIENPSISTGSL